jgi:hypothetical protein
VPQLVLRTMGEMGGFRPLLACVVSLAVAGCATLPSYRDDALSTADVVRHIKCELRDAAWAHPGNEWVRTWKAGLVLTLEAFHNGGLDSDNTWVFPLNHGATFVLALTGGFSGQANRTERISFNESIAFLNSDPQLLCSNEEPARFARLGGELGIADLLERTGRTRDVAHLTNLTQMDYNLDFVIKKAAGLNPRFNLVPIGKEKTFSGGLRWAGSTSDTQTLKITLIPPAERARGPTCARELVDGQCPLPVYIIEEPNEAPSTRGAPGTRRSAPPLAVPSVRGPAPGITRSDEDRLERGKSRNILESIDDQLRRQNIGN